MSSTDSLINLIIEKVPELQSLYRTHIEDNDSLLPHVFMGDISRFVINAACDENQAKVLRPLFDLIEAGLQSGSGELIELIGVSFLENLCEEKVALHCIVPMMGAETKIELKKICRTETIRNRQDERRTGP